MLHGFSQLEKKCFVGNLIDVYLEKNDANSNDHLQKVLTAGTLLTKSYKKYCVVKCFDLTGGSMKEVGSGCPFIAVVFQCGERKEIKAGALTIRRKNVSIKTPLPLSLPPFDGVEK